MNPAHRDGWPPAQASMSGTGQQQTEQNQGQAPRPLGTFGSSNATHQQSTQASPGQGAGPVLPPPSGTPFYSSNAASAHNQNLPSLAGLGQAPPQASPHQPGQRPPSSESAPAPQGHQGAPQGHQGAPQGHQGAPQGHQGAPQGHQGAPQGHQGAPQGPGYSLPGISQTLQQPQMHAANQSNIDRERELRERETREREMMAEAHAAQHAAQQEEIVKREAEQRDRELRDRQQHEQAAHENQSGPIQIHQPVAVAPSARSIHGPNGLLGQPGPMANPNPISGPMNGPNAPGGMFGNAPTQQGDTTPRMQHAVQPQAQSSMLMPFGAPGVQPGPMAMGQGQQPILNDALSYLDQVKVQFAEHPDVYNRFLDIMKDFKSATIDTPGVIERVSTLFAGNPNLIQGFNTFLPPGYKIECGTNGDPNAIRVTTPMGTMVSTMPAPRPLSPPRSTTVNGNVAALNESPYYDSAQNRHWPQQARNQAPEGQEAMFSPNNRNLGQPLFGAQQGQPGQAPLSPEVTNRPHPDSAASAAALAHQQEQRGVSQLQNAVSAATGRSILSPSGDTSTPLPGQAMNGANQGAQAPSVGAEKRGPVEFNHAISYVNKIKNRFASQPDIYKQFLEILQTYQRESKPIQDVYAQVTSLFSSAPDLLEDFKQFLPESAAQHRAQQQAARHAAEDAVILSNVRSEPGYGQALNHQQTPRADTSRLPPMGNFAPTPTANRDNKRKRGERQGPSAAAMPTPMAQDVPTSNVRGNYGQGNMSKRAKTGHNAKQPVVPDGPPVSPTLTPALPEPLPPSTTTSPTQDELAFFDRVKKFLGNKNIMNEFLKLCNLFSQDLIDKSLFLYRAQAFIGGNQELYMWLKKFMGDEGDELHQSRPKIVNSRVSLSNCRSLGPSYRLLPKRERERQCSGRDELCKAVLNDEWASHPTWASEDSGFVAHRKNQYEEGLHRIEEERHDYDFNIEACTRTIQQLEPIASQLLTMKGEDRLNFVLPPGLGGQSETIYKRVIMKIYGREKGRDVINELFQMPWSVIPVLLHRLKSKLEDWKAAQREWEKVWREQTQKMFWKSLDHQSLSSKQADKRQFQPKSLQNEIQVRYEEQKRMAEIQEISQPDYQFAYSFRDEEVLLDAARLIITYAENNNVADYSKVIPFIKEFIPLFFGIDQNKFEQRVQTIGRDSSTNESGEDETPSPDDALSQKSQKPKKNDLRRGVLDPHGKSRKDKEGSVASGSRDSTPDIASAMDEDGVTETSKSTTNVDRASAQWVEYSSQPTTFMEREFGVEEPYRRSVFNMYANASIYCFFRMFVILYERLLRLKENEDEVREIVTRAKEPKPAHELKMMDKLPSDFFKNTSETANYYQQVLQLFEDQIMGEADMNQIEETLRRYYLQTGWQLYSFDRLLSSLVRFILLVLSGDNKEKTVDIYNLFKKDRQNELTTHKAELTFRKAVEKYAKDADTYRIAYDPVKMESYVRLFKKDDPTFDFSALDRVKRWRCYVASFMAVEPTEEVDISRVRLPFLKNAFPRGDDADDERFETVKEMDKITVQISPESYAMKFEISEPVGPGGVQYFVQKDATRANLSEEVPTPAEEYKVLKNSRAERVREKLLRNNAWMKDVNRDDVDARKEAFKKDVEEAKTVEEADGEDVEMEL
ncbi:hypothetical protein K469DRAFT_749045 [Zopfia rhizophila CBS 207.26]|uniref:Histone deacetylase interacting domain-containing protein n=1 Tax=Zopfia rhizophila CBS 207.26 TaxID=1314779 RepID=A0A6A6EBC1_9PEZI|nr:hypothetical protein K469DRAFT_749045 [Zopfia rhizophila CBS 207.26]